MTSRSSNPPFWRTRKALLRLPIFTQLSIAAITGALALFLIQLVAAFFVTHTSRVASSSISPSSIGTGIKPRTHLPPHPKPLVIVAAGLPRTGSTWVYNVLRILARIRDPNSVAGWYADLINIWKNHKTGRYDHMKESWLTAYKSLNTSVVIKMHGPGPFKLFSHGLPLEKAADLTVITHRDLRTEVRSWVYQNWNSSIHSGEIDSTPFGDPSQWVRVAHHILDERKSTLKSIGSGRFLDIRYEDWNNEALEKQLEIIGQIANELHWDYTKDELMATAIEAARLEPPANGAVLMYNPVNKLHPGHTRVDATNPKFVHALQNGFRAIEQDPDSGQFLQLKNYV
ncbi:P-loop containing nucleoside triphosphate hydrolase [Gracilaria domingensis]|nr:P-loop containing nucleoside triphosphate hydrolase [Gracilaria domingensis]